MGGRTRIDSNLHTNLLAVLWNVPTNIKERAPGSETILRAFAQPELRDGENADWE